MQNFPQNPQINMGGMTRFYFIPSPYVTQLPPLVNNTILTPLQFIGGGSFFSGYASRESLEFNETASQDDNGTIYKQIINGMVPGGNPELTALMAEMEYYRHYVLIRDAAGFFRLAGYENPLTFLSTFKSGQKASDYKGYNFTFSGDALKRAPYYKLV